MYDVKTIQCPQCGKIFEVVIQGTGNHPMYCSDDCRKEHRREYDKRKYRETHNKCIVCGKPAMNKKKHTRYCGDECRRLEKNRKKREAVKKGLWGCKVTPSVENCCNCKFADCINNSLPTEEESKTINTMIGIYKYKIGEQV